MKGLNKNQQAQRDEFVNQLQKAHEGVTAKYSALVSAMEEYNAELEKYNAVVVEAETWGSEVTGDMQSYMDEKSERWQESEAGTTYGEWKDTWEGIDYAQIDAMEIPNEPEIESFITEFSDLPTEPE